MAETLSWPVLAEGLSPLRNYRSLNDSLVSTYDIILRDPERADYLVPKQVIQLGPLPISKVLRGWLARSQPQRWIIGSQRNLDPLHGPTHFLTTDIETIAWLATNKPLSESLSPYHQRWLAYESTVRRALDIRLKNETALVESKVVWLLSQHLPDRTPLFVANSMPVRDVEYFWGGGDRYIQPAFSRGANGIDGTLSTAMGLAHHNAPTVLLTGDLAFLHDTNGLLNIPQLSGSLTIVLINNDGGGIFEMLPVSEFEPEFEKYFLTPQQVNFKTMCETYGVKYQRIEEVRELVENIERLPEKGVSLLEVVCDRQQSVQQRKALLNAL